MARLPSDSLDGWTDEMISEFILARRSNLDGQVNALIMVEKLQRGVELFQSALESSFEESVYFLGRVAVKKDSPITYVRANIQVIPRATFGRSSMVPPGSVGWMFFSQTDALGDKPKTPTMEICLFGETETQRRLVQYFSDARLFGIAYVPLWIWWTPVETMGATAKEVVSFSIENALPISKCEWQQALSLGAPVPQDFFDPAR